MSLAHWYYFNVHKNWWAFSCSSTFRNKMHKWMQTVPNACMFENYRVGTPNLWVKPRAQFIGPVARAKRERTFKTHENAQEGKKRLVSGTKEKVQDRKICRRRHTFATSSNRIPNACNFTMPSSKTAFGLGSWTAIIEAWKWIKVAVTLALTCLIYIITVLWFIRKTLN